MKNINEVQLKKVFLFIVCGTDPGEKDKIEKIVKDNLPGELKSKFEIFFLRGRLRRNTLSWSDKLLLKIGAYLTRDPKDKNNMKKDYDSVKKENLLPLLNSVGKYAQDEEKKNPVSTPIQP
jgi:hypothetical protein